MVSGGARWRVRRPSRELQPSELPAELDWNRRAARLKRFRLAKPDQTFSKAFM